MITQLLGVVLLSASAAVAQADFDRTIPVSAQPDLYVSTGSGRIHVYPGNDSQIHVTAHLRPGYNVGGDVQERMRRIASNPPIQVSGNTVKIGDMGGGDRGLFQDIRIDYDVSAPVSVAMNLRSGSGNVEVDNLGRYAKVESGAGAVRVHGLSGPADLRSGSGDVELQERAPGDVRAVTGSGSIRIEGLNGGAQLRTGSGDLEVGGHLAGPANLQAGSGSIRVHLGRDARFTVEASTGSGTIRVSQPGAPRESDESHHLSGPVNGGGPLLKANTGSGDIEIN